MVRYIFNRLSYIIIVLLLLSAIIFSVTHLLPGSAANLILGEYATEEKIQKLEKKLGLDKPFYHQYWNWLKRIPSGDWGQSMVMQQPVTTLIKLRLKNSDRRPGGHQAQDQAGFVYCGRLLCRYLRSGIRDRNPADSCVGRSAGRSLSYRRIPGNFSRLGWLVQPFIAAGPDFDLNSAGPRSPPNPIGHDQRFEIQLCPFSPLEGRLRDEG